MDFVYIIKFIFVSLILINIGAVLSGLIISAINRFAISVIKSHKSLLPFIIGVAEILGSFLFVFLVALVFGFIKMGGSIYVIIFYTILLLNNDIGRISNIKKDRSPVWLLMKLNGEEDSYDKKNDLKKEFFALFGGLVGLFLGVIYYF